MSPRGLPAPGKKVTIRVEKESRKLKLPLFDSLSTLLLTFLGPGAGRPRELILNFVSNFGPEGPKNSSGGIEGSRLSGSIFGHFRSFSTVFGQFGSKTANIDSKSAPLEGIAPGAWRSGGGGL